MERSPISRTTNWIGNSMSRDKVFWSSFGRNMYLSHKTWIQEEETRLASIIYLLTFFNLKRQNCSSIKILGSITTEFVITCWLDTIHCFLENPLIFINWRQTFLRAWQHNFTGCIIQTSPGGLDILQLHPESEFYGIYHCRYGRWWMIIRTVRPKKGSSMYSNNAVEESSGSIL